MFRRLDLLVEILQGDEKLRRELRDLFNDNYRTFIEYLYPSLVMRHRRLSGGDQIKQLQMLQKLHNYLRSGREPYIASAEAACARRFIRDLVFFHIMSTQTIGVLKNHEITATATKAHTDPRLNLARVTLNYVGMKTKVDVYEPFSKLLPVRKLIEEVSKLVEDRDGSSVAEVAECLFGLHGPDDEPPWARAVHFQGIGELSVQALIDTMKTRQIDDHSAYVKISPAGLIYLQQFVTSLDVFVAKHEVRHESDRSRHLCEILFEDLRPEDLPTFVQRILGDAIEQLRICAKSLNDFARIQAVPRLYPHLLALCQSDLVFDHASHQERLASSFQQELKDFRMAWSVAIGFTPSQKTAVTTVVDGAYAELEILKNEARQWRS